MTIVVRLPFMARKDPPAVMRVAGGTHFNQCSSTTALWLIRSHIGALVMAVIMLHSDSDFLSPSLFFFFFFFGSARAQVMNAIMQPNREPTPTPIGGGIALANGN